MYRKRFEIRWSDVDANKHLANSAYTNFMSDTRMAAFQEIGLTFKALAKHDLSPVVFYEHTYYFKEALGEEVYVSLELSGLSEDGMFFSFNHNFYDKEGKNLAYSEMLGAWMDFKDRKLIPLPEEFLRDFDDLPRTENFRVLTKEDTRRYGKKPIDISL